MDIQQLNYINDLDIEIELLPNPDKDIYLTGDEPEFSLRIANSSETDRRHGVIVLYWYIENTNTPSPVAFDLGPGEETVIDDVFSVWLGQTGTGECHLPCPSDETGKTMSPERIKELFRRRSEIDIPSEGKLDTVPGFIHEFQNAVGHVICQFRIRDRAIVHDERERARERKKLLDAQRDLAAKQTELTQKQSDACVKSSIPNSDSVQTRNTSNTAL